MFHPSRCLPGLHLLNTWSFPLKHCTDQYAAMLFFLDRVSTDMRELICTMRLSLCNPSPFTAPHSLDLTVVLWRIMSSAANISMGTGTRAGGTRQNHASVTTLAGTRVYSAAGTGIWATHKSKAPRSVCVSFLGTDRLA